MDKLSVRSLLLGNDGKYIKAIDQRDFSDFIGMLANKPTSQSMVVLCDFSPLINCIHRLGDELKSHVDNELLVKRDVAYNSWVRLKTFKKETMLEKAALDVMKDSESVLNWIHIRLSELKLDYKRANDTNNNGFNTEKTMLLTKMVREVDVFIEMLLCNIHATVTVDLDSLKDDTVITGHIVAIFNLLKECIESEIDFYKNNLESYSLIYQCCMEDMGIIPDALFQILGINKTSDGVRAEIINQSKTDDEYEKYRTPHRIQTIEWPKACPHKLKRTKMLLSAIQKVLAVIDFMDLIKKSDVSYDVNSINEEFDNIESLLLNKTT